MKDSATGAAAAVPTHVQLIQMCAGGWVAAAVYAAAKLGIADHLATGAKSAAELAPVTGYSRTVIAPIHADARRIRHPDRERWRAVRPHAAGRSARRPAHQARPAPPSSRLAAPPFWRAWEELTYSLETGQPAFDKLWGMPFFDYLGQHPEAASHFSEAMVGFHGSEPPTVAEAYDFSGIQTVVDVGGATGNMLAAVLSRHSGLRGVLYDLPHVVGDAPALLKARGVADRVTIETGQLLRAGACRRGRLSPVAHHS